MANRDKEINHFSKQKIIKISIYLRDIGEIETMTATYFFEDGTKKEGCSYNNNSLDGDIYFSDVEDLVYGEGPFPMKDFMASFMENSWTQFIQESVDNFSGEGNSIDYDYDEFEDYEELNSEGCEWDADDLEPNSITLFFEKSELTLDSDSDAGTYKNNEITFTKKELLNLIKKNASSTTSNDKNKILAAVKENGFALKGVDKPLKKDKEIVLAAVRQRGDALQYADKSLQKDREIVLAAFKTFGIGSALEYAYESLKKDKEIVMAAVKQVGSALEYADESLQKDREIVMAAIKQDGFALNYASKELKNDPELQKIALG